MKKLFPILAAACLMAACNSGSSSTTSDSTATTSADTTSVMSTDTSKAAATDTSASNSTAIKDSVITIKDGKVLISSNGNWSPLTADVTLSNGIKVTTKGEITKGGKKKKLTEGEKIDKDGQLTDANGKLIDNAGW